VKNGYNDLWFLVWRRRGKRPFATSICGYYRKDVLAECLQFFGGPKGWEAVRKQGASIERIDVTPPNSYSTP